MELTGKLTEVTKDYISDRYKITFEINESEFIGEVENLKDKLLSLSVKKNRSKRSLNANALLWKCIEEIVEAIPCMDRFSVYKDLLRKYGQSTVIYVDKEAVEDVKKAWRESDDLGTVWIDGEEKTELLCYYGSSAYDTKEFSVLLDGTIYEMEQLGIQPPTSRDMERSLKLWEEEHK